jgi:hypothetical protein
MLSDGDLSDGAARPVQRDGASAVELDENLALYDGVGQLLILLNPSAATVWELCDGTRTVDDMIDVLTEAHPDEARVIAGDVRQTIRKLAELGLVGAVAEATES